MYPTGGGRSGDPHSVAGVRVASHHPDAYVWVDGFEPSNIISLAAPTRVVDTDQGGLSAASLRRYIDGTGKESAAYRASW